MRVGARRVCPACQADARSEDAAALREKEAAKAAEKERLRALREKWAAAPAPEPEPQPEASGPQVPQQPQQPAAVAPGRTVPACPHCGGARREALRKSEEANILKWVGFGLAIVGVIGCVAVGVGALLIGGPGMILLIVGGIWEAATKKRWWICPACDTAEEAPRRASDL